MARPQRSETMLEPVAIRYEVTESDLAEVALRSARASWLGWVWGLLLVVGVLGAVDTLLDLRRPGTGPGDLTGEIALRSLLLVAALVAPLVLRELARREHRSNASRQGPQVMEVTGDGIEVRSSCSRELLDWAAVRALEEHPAHLVVRLSDRTGHVVPRDALGDLEPTLRAWFASKGRGPG